MTRTVLLVLLFAGMGAGLSACGGASPTGSTGATSGSSSSVGNALTRLQADYAAGTISEAEYDRQRRAILLGAGA